MDQEGRSLKVAIVRERDLDGNFTICAILIDFYLVGEGQTNEAALAELRLTVAQTLAANRADGVADFHGIKPCPIMFHSLEDSVTYTDIQITG